MYFVGHHVYPEISEIKKKNIGYTIMRVKINYKN
jgi:hypothetical protein